MTDGSSALHDKKRNEPMMLKILTYCSFIVPALIGIVSLVSWASQDVAMISISQSYVPIVPSTSVSILLLSFALYMCYLSRPNRILKFLAVASIISALGINLWILAPVSPDPEEILDPIGQVVNGYNIERASPITLIATICCCIVALLLFLRLNRRSRIADSVLTTLALILFSIGVVTTIGYLYGNPLLYGAPIKPVAFLAALSFFFFGIGAILLKGESTWPLRSFLGPTVKARLLRVFLPVSILVIIIEGMVLMFFMPESTSPNNTILTSTIALFTAVLMGVLISRISNQMGTDIDRTNNLLIKTTSELQQANEHLKVLDSITRHDSINQLTILMGRLGMIKELIPENDLKQQIDEPIKAAKSIEEILMFARDYQAIGNEEPSWFLVKQVFDKSVEVVRVPSSMNINAEVGGLYIFADKMLEKVFLNLLDNSMRYGERVKNIRLFYRKHIDGGVRLVYEDDGVGISYDDKQNLFKRGFGKHTGLGLFLSKEILGFTGITISEKGEPGKGASFEMEIPDGKYCT